MELLIETNGNVRCLYSETIDLHSLGIPHIQRGSHVEPTTDGQWIADLSPVRGPILGPVPHRSDALAAEEAWLLTHWLIPSIIHPPKDH